MPRVEGAWFKDVPWLLPSSSGRAVHVPLIASVHVESVTWLEPSLSGPSSYGHRFGHVLLQGLTYCLMSYV